MRIYGWKPALVFAAMMAVSSAFAGDASRTVRKRATDFALKDAAGKTVRLSDYRGKVVLLDFWATTCGGCKVEIPWFAEFERTYGPRRFAVVGVALDEEGWRVVKPFIDQNKLPYRVVAGDDATADKYGVQAMPSTFVIDRQGWIAASHVGLVDKSVIESEIRVALGK